MLKMIGLQILRNQQQLAKRTKEILQTSLQVLSVMATTHSPLRPTQFTQRSSPKLRRLRTTEFLITCIGLLAILGCESIENANLLSRDYPHFIMSFSLETNDDTAVYDSWGILENTAASFMTYCLVNCKSNSQIDPREFERLCTEAEAVLKQDQTEFFPNFEHRAIRNCILKPYGMRDA